MEPITHQQKLEWMAMYAVRNHCQLELAGECGFGRECVGILREGVYPDYEWEDNDTCERLDKNGDVWTPPDAYHKHPCVAVLGRGEAAESQLYDWLTWFESNGFTLQSGDLPVGRSRIPIALEIALGRHRYHRMVKGEGV